MRAVVPVLTAIFLANAVNAADPVNRMSSAASLEESTKVLVKYKQGVVTTQGVRGPGNTRIFSINVDEAEAFATQLRLRPEIESVALDLIVRNPPLPTPAELAPSRLKAAGAVPAGAPTDPGFDRQISWTAPDELNAGVQNLLAGYLASERTKRLRIGILDSGFYPVSDIVYASGYNFSSFSGSEVDGPDYLENEVNPDCTSPHGTAVTGIIGATANNGVGVAGILDAELIAARVLSCDTGLLSDTALGIRWLAGDPSVTEAPLLGQPVDIINASLGAKVGSCPFYLQEAIDYAYEQGILVVVAAGNEDTDAQNSTPANCRNVVTVGSVGRDGVRSSFSNYGDKVDLGALGELVATVNLEGEVSQWFGTSFAAPVVAGTAGLLKQANPSLAPDELRNELVASSRPLVEPQTLAGQEARVFGSGIVDAGKSVQNIAAQLDQLRPEIRPALDAIERCNREAYIANAPAGMDFSELFEVTSTNVELARSDEFYAVFRSVASGDKELLHLGKEPRFLLRNVDLDADKLWFDVCGSEGIACRFDKSLPM